MQENKTPSKPSVADTSEPQRSAIRQHMVEVALGVRVVKHGHNGYQAQMLNEWREVDGEKKMVVRPATPLEFRMFEMLCTGDEGWS